MLEGGLFHQYIGLTKTTYFAIIAGQLLFIDTEVKGNQEQESTMTNITKHHGEKERERNDGEKTRIDFTITSNTISIDNALETLSEFVCTVISGTSLFSV